jgi:hypothetical protein
MTADWRLPIVDWKNDTALLIATGSGGRLATIPASSHRQD